MASVIGTFKPSIDLVHDIGYVRIAMSKSILTNNNNQGAKKEHFQCHRLSWHLNDATIKLEQF